MLVANYVGDAFAQRALRAAAEALNQAVAMSLAGADVNVPRVASRFASHVVVRRCATVRGVTVEAAAPNLAVT